MEDRTRKILVIIGIVIILIGIGVIIFITKNKNENYKPRTEEKVVDNYVEDKNINLDEVAKKDRELIQKLIKLVPYSNGLYQSIYSGNEVNIENIKKELLFNVLYNNVSKIKDNEEFNKLKQENNIDKVDYFIKKQDIIDEIKKIYNYEITDLPNEIELLKGSATLFGDYYSIILDKEKQGLEKITKVLSYSISDNSIIVYEKPAFIKKEDNTVIIYSDDLGQNEILKLENKNDNEIRKEINNNIDKLVTFEQIYKKTNDIYYWNSVSGAKEGK